MSEMGDWCPSTEGREGRGHSLILVTMASHRWGAFSKCAKCGEEWPKLIKPGSPFVLTSDT